MMTMLQFRPGTVVKALRPLDPSGANVPTGTLGVVTHAANFFEDHSGPMVEWVQHGCCQIYPGDALEVGHVSDLETDTCPN